jgi:isopenicillin N synthase-like dioxygenase
LKINDIIGAFHRDWDLFTVHGKCRYAGLFAWLLTGERFPVTVPDGHLLVQGGKQLEWITGGFLKAGFHEVIHSELV